MDAGFIYPQGKGKQMLVRHIKSFIGLTIAIICSLGTIETEEPVEEKKTSKLELAASEKIR